MQRYRLLLEYDGTPFSGWQRQSHRPSVQAALEAAIEAAFGETVTIQAAGRTDAGVHATGQVAHVDLSRWIAPERLVGAINFHLRPQPVAVIEARAVSADFHARFSATARHYRYRIVNRRAPVPLERGRAWHVARPLNAELMQAAARALIGHHDFTSFRASGCQAASPVKTLSHLWVWRDGMHIEIGASAPSFLHHQVRNIVGTLKEIGEGKREVAFVKQAMKARDRSAAGVTAPAHGLYLVGVDYPGDPARPVMPGSAPAGR